MNTAGIVALILAVLKIVSALAGPITDAMERSRRQADDDLRNAQKDKIAQAIKDAQTAP